MMKSDPIVEEVREVRSAQAERCNNDLEAIVGDFRRLERELVAEPETRQPKPAVSRCTKPAA